MRSPTDRLEFAPPRETRSAKAFGLAIFAHLLLLGALTWGVNWKRSDTTPAFEAELWSALPQQAAPRAVEPPPPPPPPAPKPEPRVPEPPKPEPKAAPEPVKPNVDIALEQEKKRKLLEQKKEADAAALKREAEAAALKKEQALAAKEKEREKEKEKELRAKEDLAKRKLAEEKKLAETKKFELEKAQQDKLVEAAAEKRHADEVRRITGMAGATGAADATGSAQRASGPSGSYAGKVAAKVLPNVLSTDDIVGNPKAEVEVSSAPDGTIVGRRLVKSSGNRAWDEAVLKAIDRTGAMPRDTDGRVPTPIVVVFQPR